MYDFLCYVVRTLKHTKVTDIVDDLSLIICEKSKKKGNDMFFHVLQCQAQIAKRVGRLKDETIKNESGIRYVYGNPITDMLVDAFGFKLQVEESMDKS